MDGRDGKTETGSLYINVGFYGVAPYLQSNTYVLLKGITNLTKASSVTLTDIETNERFCAAWNELIHAFII